MITYINIIIIIIIIYIVSYNIKYKRINENISDELFDVPFNIKRENDDLPTVISGVPLIIYQSWHTNRVPKNMKLAIYKLLDMNPEFDYYLYSDEKCREFISANYSEDVVNAFDTLKPGAFKSDLWRYCILYKTGGVYLDIKYYSVLPLMNLIKTNPIIYTKENDKSCNPEYFKVYNGFMVSPPNNIVFKICIDEIIKNCSFKLYKHGPLHITGPCLLGRILHAHYGKNYEDLLKVDIDLKSDDDFRIIYNNNELLKSYSEYRAEQKTFQKTERYNILWNNKNIYEY